MSSIFKKFNFNKLYIDCIDEDGNCFIFYWAVLNWGILKINYSSVIHSSHVGRTKETTTFRKQVFPKIEDEFSFHNKKLKLHGEVNLLSPSIYEKLLNDDGKTIDWHCHHPKTNLQFSYNNNNYSGYGYCETISMTAKPWELPIIELRWGRYLSKQNTIIWIEWIGEKPINYLFHNENKYEDAQINEQCIVFNKGVNKLEFESPDIIRNNKLSSILKKFPFLKIFFNKKILNTNELKLKSKTTFRLNNIEVDQGWSLYEFVKWK